MALSPTKKKLLTQSRLDSLVAKHIYDRRVAALRRASSLVDYLAVAVPVLYFPIRYLAKGTSYHVILEAIWEILAAVLIALVLLKVLYGWTEKAESYSTARSENMQIANQIRSLLTGKIPTESAELDIVLSASGRQDVSDQQELGRLTTREKKSAYREALKELDPDDVDVKCPVCYASPWHYKKGSCNACGNTPAKAGLI